LLTLYFGMLNVDTATHLSAKRCSQNLRGLWGRQYPISLIEAWSTTGR